METRDRGAVLLLVLILLVVLTAVVVQFMYSTSVNSRIADAQLAQLKNDAAVDGGVAKAISLLLEDMAAEEGAEGRIDSLSDLWAAGPGILTFDDTELRMLVADEQGKLNLNLLAVPAMAFRVKVELKRLLQSVGLDESEADEAARAIADRIDEDSEGEFEEDSTNRKLFDPSELIGIEQVGELVYYGGVPVEDEEDDAEPETDENLVRKGLHRFVTVWGPGLVNINTAPAEVLAALSGTMGLETAAAVVEYRRDEGPFSSAQGLLQVEGVTQEMLSKMSKRICVVSSYFSVLCFVETAGVKSVGIGVVERSKKGCRILHSSMDDNRLWQTYLEEIEGMGKEEEEEESWNSGIL